MTLMETTQSEKLHQDEAKSLLSHPDDLWIFGYGSLMWRPGFSFVERHVARVHGYRRSFCILSHAHRGTVEKPGLVLGLDRGGSCVGVAFRVAIENRQATIGYLREREQVTGVYLEKTVMAEIGSKGPVPAVTYVVDRTHCQYSGQLSDSEKLAFIRQGHGISGHNPDYVRSTHEHLLTLGIRDATIARLVAALEKG